MPDLTKRRHKTYHWSFAALDATCAVGAVVSRTAAFTAGASNPAQNARVRILPAGSSSAPGGRSAAQPQLQFQGENNATVVVVW